MLDFRRASRAPYSWTGRQQMLGVFLVVALGLVFGVTHDWRQWRWLFEAPSPGAEKSAGQRAQKNFSVDTRVPLRTSDRDLPGTFVSPLPQTAENEETPPSRYFRGVMPTYLQSIQDDSPFLATERDAWFNLLDVLGKSDLKAIKKASIGRATFVQLFRQSAEYRGELVTICGAVRWVHRLTAPKNDYEIEDYYQIWLTPEDNPDNLEVVYALRLPPEFPRGRDLAEDVEITGFFFKRWLYRAKDTVRTAPVVLAQTVEWQKRPVFVRRTDASLGTVVGIVVGTGLGAILVAAYVHFRTRSVRGRRRSGAEATREDNP